MNKYLKLNILHVFIILILIISGFFTAKIPFDKNLQIVSSFAIIFFALPSFYYFIKKHKSWTPLVILGVYAIVIESIAINTGIPYGKFYYTEKIGFKILNLVPWTVAFAYIPLVLGSYSIAYKLSKKYSIIFSTIILLWYDLVLDPAATKLSIWVWENPGFYYGIPLSNFFGWIVTGLISSLILSKLVKIPNIKISYSILIITIFWSSVAFFSGLLIPAFLGLILIILAAHQLKILKIPLKH